MILKQNELKLETFKEDLLKQCPQKVHESFAQGYIHIVTEFFDNLKGCILVDIVDPGVYDFNLSEYIDFLMDQLPYETGHLKVHQLQKFYEGVQFGLLKASNLIELVALDSENSTAA